MRRTGRWGTVTSLIAALVLIAGAAGATTVERVDGGDLGHDWSQADTREDGKGTFAVGPGDPPFGEGSYHMTTTDSNADKVQLMTDRFAGTPLAEVERIAYSTYRDSSSADSPALPAINLRVDCDGDGVADTYLVAEPYWQDTEPDRDEIVNDTWQQWAMIEPNADDDRWWSSSDCGELDQQIGGPGNDWSTVVASVPNGTIAEGDDGFFGSLGVNLGSFNRNIVGAADGLQVVLTDGTDVTFDFEPSVTCGDDGLLDGSGLPLVDEPGSLVNDEQDEDGPVSGPLHDLDRDTGLSPVHEANCDVVVTAESQAG